MASPGYTEDLTDIALATAAETWVEITGATAGGAPADETDYFIEGTSCKSENYNALGVGSLAIDKGTPQTINSGDASFHWLWWGAPNSLASRVDGGYRVAIGSSVANYKMWYVSGSDVNPFGGWLNVAVDPLCAADAVQGTPTSSYQVFGSVVNNSNKVAKGQVYGNDAIRVGRSLICTGGETSNYANFASAASADGGVVTNRWGLCLATQGGYLVKGRFQIGAVAASADFRDSNKAILIQDLTRVQPTFTVFDIRNADSVVGWNSISFLALGTNARGILSAYNNATMSITGCVFTDMASFYFCPAATINNSTFRRTGTIYQSGATFDGCTFDSCRDSTTISASNIGLISNSSFISDGSNHAIEIATLGVCAAYTLTTLSYTNYTAGGTGVSGDSGNESVYNNSGQHVKLTIDGGDVPSYRDGAGASTEIVTNQRILTLTGVISGSEIRIYDQAGPPPNDLGGIETFSPVGDTGDFDYTYTYAASTYVDIIVHKANYLWYKVNDYLLLDSNASLPIAQQQDRQYSNP